MALWTTQNVPRRREVLPCNTAGTSGRRHYGRSPIRVLSIVAGPAELGFRETKQHIFYRKPVLSDE